ncbi:MAG: hydroxyacid dehydrogenase [Rhodomicrobiaceae bacterium]
MADIIISEFIDAEPLERFEGWSVHGDDELWSRRGDLLAAMAGAKAIIVRNRTQVDAELLAHAPQLAVVGRLGVGLDNIDLETCKARGIAVCPAVGANAQAVAEYVVASALVLLRWSAFSGWTRLMRGEWPRQQMGEGHEAAGKTLGLIGFGSIGQVTAAKARALGLRTLGCDAFLAADSPAWADTERADLQTVLTRSDIISLHCPLTPETRGLVGAAEIAAMKPGAILINTARGGIVEEGALAAALRSGHLAGAAIDVFDAEPITEAVAALFAGLPNVILTPHIAGITVESNSRISAITVENVLKVLKECGL